MSGIKQDFEKNISNIKDNRPFMVYSISEYSQKYNRKYSQLAEELEKYGIKYFFDIFINKNFILNTFDESTLMNINEFYKSYISFIKPDNEEAISIKKSSAKNYKKITSIFSLENDFSTDKSFTSLRTINAKEEYLINHLNNYRRNTIRNQEDIENKIYLGYIPVGTVRINDSEKYIGEMNILSKIDTKNMVVCTDSLPYRDSYSVNLEFKESFNSIDDAYEYVLEYDYFIFKLEKREGNSGEYYYPKIISSIKHQDDTSFSKMSVLNRYSFEQIPIFTSDSISIEEFNKNINNEYIIGNSLYVNESTIQKIAWYDAEQQRYYIYDGIKNVEKYENKYKFELDDDYEIYSCSKIIALKQQIIIHNDKVMFITPETFNYMIDNNKLNLKSELIKRNDDYNKDYIANANLNKKLQQRKQSNNTDEVNISKIEIESEVNNIDTLENNPCDDMISRLHHVMEQWNVAYKDSDLVSFHNAMKLRDMVILSGLSGTGKSQLVQLYANALGMPQEQLKFLSVSPAWQDDTDLLGYVDINHGVFHPSESGLVDLLIDAEKHPNQLYMVCFDEMNLSKVEYYFSQFLSILELKDSNQRYIKIYNDELSKRLYNSDKYPSKIKIMDNVLFVGTINTDESTYNLSDKVLDRVNVINLEMVPFYDLDFSKDSKYKFESTNNLTTINTDIFNNWCHEYNEGLTNEMKHFLWELHHIMNEVHYNLGIGLRTVSHINKYLSFIDVSEEEFGEYFDNQLCQRIFTKLRGSEIQLKDLLTEDGKIIQLLNKYQEISTFERTRRLLAQKDKELKDNGYAM